MLISKNRLNAPQRLCCREYNTLCPDTWQIVNSTDIVPRIGKFGRLYKHPGLRVIIDRKGSILVRPSPLELHLRQGKRLELPNTSLSQHHCFCPVNHEHRVCDSWRRRGR